MDKNGRIMTKIWRSEREISRLGSSSGAGVSGDQISSGEQNEQLRLSIDRTILVLLMLIGDVGRLISLPLVIVTIWMAGN